MDEDSKNLLINDERHGSMEMSPEEALLAKLGKAFLDAEQGNVKDLVDRILQGELLEHVQEGEH